MISTHTRGRCAVTRQVVASVAACVSCIRGVMMVPLYARTVSNPLSIALIPVRANVGQCSRAILATEQAVIPSRIVFEPVVCDHLHASQV